MVKSFFFTSLLQYFTSDLHNCLQWLQGASYEITNNTDSLELLSYVMITVSSTKTNKYQLEALQTP